MSQNCEFDVIVIGAGPGGYVAAIRAAQLGLRAAVAERGSLGGVCLNMGCVPSKAIIGLAGAYRGRFGLEALGVRVDDSGFRYEGVFAASRRAAETLSKGVAYLLKKNRVEVIAGVARVVSGHEVEVVGAGGINKDGGIDKNGGISKNSGINENGGIDRDSGINKGSGGRVITAGSIIVATGSRPKPLPGLEFDGKWILSSDDALMMRELPRRALVVGAGAIGAEFAHILNAFGTEVHIAEAAGGILPGLDADVGALVGRSFAKRGMKIHASSKVSSYCIVDDSINAVIEEIGGSGGRTEVPVDKIFVMAGRAPNTEGIGLEGLGVKMSGPFVEAGDYYQTSVESVYAIGDIVANSPMLAHVASKQGEIAAERIAGRAQVPPRIDETEIPAAVFCDPEAASFGLTEGQAATRGVPFAKMSFPFRACGKAVALGDSEGFVKVLADPDTKKILGAHIVGTGAPELIHELLLAKGAGLDVVDIAELIHAHPTLSEAVMESARGILGWAIHV